MRTLWKGAISFGLVNIPVKMYTATERKDIHFNQLHATCKTPIQYRKFCPVCQKEVGADELVRGYEYEKGRYVILRDEDFELLPGENTKTIDILDFVDLAEIDPVYFDRSYYQGPNPGGEKAYNHLNQAMQETGKIAIARVMIRTKTVSPACARGKGFWSWRRCFSPMRSVPLNSSPASSKRSNSTRTRSAWPTASSVTFPPLSTRGNTPMNTGPN